MSQKEAGSPPRVVSAQAGAGERPRIDWSELRRLVNQWERTGVFPEREQWRYRRAYLKRLPPEARQKATEIAARARHLAHLDGWGPR